MGLTPHRSGPHDEASSIMKIAGAARGVLAGRVCRDE